jgi:hypothetical protein
MHRTRYSISGMPLKKRYSNAGYGSNDLSNVARHRDLLIRNYQKDGVGSLPTIPVTIRPIRLRARVSVEGCKF